MGSPNVLRFLLVNGANARRIAKTEDMGLAGTVGAVFVKTRRPAPISTVGQPRVDYKSNRYKHLRVRL